MTHPLRDIVYFIRDITVIFLIVILIRTFIVQPFQISGHSMDSSYADSEFIILDRWSYLMPPTQNTSSEGSQSGIAGLYQSVGNWISRMILSVIPLYIGDPKRGDVVVLMPHTMEGRAFFIKRIIGMPGDQIDFRDGKVFIKEKGSSEFIELKEGYLNEENNGKTYLPDFEERVYTVPENEYFAMGDNRNHSTDSRSCFYKCSRPNASPFLKRSDVVGKVLISLGCPTIGTYITMPSGDKLCKQVSPARLGDTPKEWSYSELN